MATGVEETGNTDFVRGEGGRTGKEAIDSEVVDGELLTGCELGTDEIGTEETGFIRGEGGRTGKEAIDKEASLPVLLTGKTDLFRGEGGKTGRAAIDSESALNPLIEVGDDETGLNRGDGGNAFSFSKDLLIAEDLDKLIAGKGASKPFDTGIGDGAAEIDGRIILSRLLEADGVAVGLGVELRAVPTLGFKRPVLVAVGLVFCDNGTKTDDRIDILFLLVNFLLISNVFIFKLIKRSLKIFLFLLCF